MTDKKGLDLLGIQPISSAIDTTVKKSLEGIEGFLQLVCKPALGEIGLMAQDQVRHWRLNNIIKMLNKAEGKLDFQNGKLELKSHPRVAISIIENSSLIDDNEIQEMWGGLFASSCTENGKDDENLIFSDILKLLTNAQAKIIKYSVQNCRKILYPNGLVIGERIRLTGEELVKLTGIENHHRIDRELDYLSTIGLIDGGYSPSESELIANIGPTYLALSLFVKCEGYDKNPDDYFKDEMITKGEVDEEERIEQKEKAESEALKRKQLAESKKAGNTV